MTEQTKKLKIGLFGLGCVGRGFLELLPKTFRSKAEIRKICVRDIHKTRGVQFDGLTDKPEEILNDTDIDVVVELIDDADASWEIVQKALNNGKSVVSANKRMIAKHLAEIIELQQQSGLSVLYEAAVCASIPIIRNLEEYFSTDLLESLQGIINGSSNYILSQAEKQGIGISEAIHLAQKLGFAEADPCLDIEGHDAANKLCILLAHAFGHICNPESIIRIGIDKIQTEDLTWAAERDLRIKLLAKANIQPDGSVQVYVLPHFIDSEHPLYGVRDENNGVIIESIFSEKQSFVGKGAGSIPTAAAVISDLAALYQHYQYPYHKIVKGDRISELDLSGNLRVRITCNNAPELQTALLGIGKSCDGIQQEIVEELNLLEIQKISKVSGIRVIAFDLMSYKKYCENENSNSHYIY